MGLPLRIDWNYISVFFRRHISNGFLNGRYMALPPFDLIIAHSPGYSFSRTEFHATVRTCPSLMSLLSPPPPFCLTHAHRDPRQDARHHRLRPRRLAALGARRIPRRQGHLLRQCAGAADGQCQGRALDGRIAGRVGLCESARAADDGDHMDGRRSGMHARVYL
jgi:hypothetical protein